MIIDLINLNLQKLLAISSRNWNQFLLSNIVIGLLITGWLVANVSVYNVAGFEAASLSHVQELN